MIYIVINFVPIAVATLVGIAFGYFYFRVLDDGPHARLLNPSNLVIVTAMEFWLQAILAGGLILAPPEASAWTMAIGTAIIIWVGFLAPAIIVDSRLRDRSFSSACIDAGHWLGVMLIGAILMQIIGLTPPPG
ncbi:MAG: hypothetical protein AAGH38_04230 [Pseudomonadota bacterium]